MLDWLYIGNIFKHFLGAQFATQHCQELNKTWELLTSTSVISPLIVLVHLGRFGGGFCQSQATTGALLEFKKLDGAIEKNYKEEYEEKMDKFKEENSKIGAYTNRFVGTGPLILG